MTKQTFLSQRSGFLPPTVVSFLKRRLWQSFGLIISFISIPLGVLLATYQSSDPSLNTATDRVSQNLLAAPGSMLADILIQLFGVAPWLLIPAFVILGGHLLLEKHVRHVVARSFSLCLATLIASCLLGLVPNNTIGMMSAGCGGAIGDLTQARFVEIMSTFGWVCANIALFATFVFSYGYAVGVTVKAIKRFVSFMKRAQKIDEPIVEEDYKAEPQIVYPSEPLEPEFSFSYEDVSEEELEEDLLEEEIAVEDIPIKRPAPKPAAKKVRIPLPHGEDYHLPSPSLLDDASSKHHVKPPSSDVLQDYARQLEAVLQEFGVRGDIVAVYPGPVVTLYELKPAAGIKTARVIGLADDIARSMSALSARIAVVPGRNVIGIEMPNPVRETVFLRDLLLTETYQNASAALPLILGKDIGGQPVIADMVRMPHLLVAGTTGSGKSVSVNTMILSVLFRFPPDKCRFIMIDPKMLELSIYDGIPHLLTPVVTDPKKAVVALKWAVREMESRYRAMSKLGVRNIDGYNDRIQQARATGELLMRRVQTGFDPDSGKPIFETQSLDVEPLPFIIVVVDEMADLMMVAGKEIEAAVQRLAQMARAAGIHLIMATQRPSVDVITGTIKANFPTRISFQVTSKIDSRTILGDQGAEQLLGQGDMLYMAGGGRVTRVHGPFVRDDEVERIVQFLKMQGEPTYVDSITEEDPESAEVGEESRASDPLYQQAVELIKREGKASTSFVQRYLQIGYNRAARIVEQMEKEGIVSPANNAGKREVLVS